MFSGIVEAVEKVIKVESGNETLRLWVRRPQSFLDISLGDSIAVNGVCLTVENFNHDEIVFSLGAESLKILKITPTQILQSFVNLERSLKFGDRIHGHFVSGHVDGLGTVVKSEYHGDCYFLDVKIPTHLSTMFWKKGSITLHGVSLTINEIESNVVSVCLIPETIKRTNLTFLKIEDHVHIEPDIMAKAFIQFFESSGGFFDQLISSKVDNFILNKNKQGENHVQSN